MVWTGWNLARICVLLVGIAYLMIFVQVTLFHYRQNFRNPAMWFPVIGGPLVGGCGILLALSNIRALLGLFQVLLWVGMVAGIIGFYFHLRGIGQRVGGYGMNNLLVGPPLMLPLMFSALGLFGVFAIYWR